MVLTVQIFQIVFCIIAILFMITLMFIGIWGFITFNKMYKNQRIQNFLLDKIYQSLSSINLNATYSQEKSETIEDEFNVDEFINAKLLQINILWFLLIIYKFSIFNSIFILLN